MAITFPDDAGLALLDTSEPEPAAFHWRERSWAWLSAVALLLTVALAGALLVVLGSRTVKPPPAPLPARTFSKTDLTRLPAPAHLPAAGSVASADTGSDFSGADRLFVPSLGINAPIVDDDTRGSQLVGPGDIATVGRWTGGADLDDTSGTVDLAGHVDYVGKGKGALYNLYRVSAGALVVTTDSDGRRTPWRITALEVVAKDKLPGDLFASDGPRVLKIITCGGALVPVPGTSGGFYSYADNVIATAVPVG